MSEDVIELDSVAVKYIKFSDLRILSIQCNIINYNLCVECFFKVSIKLSMNHVTGDDRIEFSASEVYTNYTGD